jgi:hypothetical protein
VLAVIFLAATFSTSAQQVAESPPPHQRETPKSTQDYYAGAHPYIDEPLEQLRKRIPELDTVKRATDQQLLPALLQRTGEQADESFRNIVDLAAQENIIEERLDKSGKVVGHQSIDASYLIVHRGSSAFGSIDEYRMDAKGEHLIEPGLSNGYLVTSNFALLRAHFCSFLQPESQFRYLGEQSVGSRQAHVVAFAQKPEEATRSVTMAGEVGFPPVAFHVQMLVQGIAWIDQETAQILRIRTDLLAPRLEIGLDSLTTTVTSSEFHLADVSTPLWLPSAVQVAARFTETDTATGASHVETFRNEHHYSGYQLYRSSVRMVPEVATQPSSALAQPGNSSLAITPEQLTRNYYAGARPYLEDPLNRLAKRIPELKKLQPATDQKVLPALLQKAGNKVDGHFSNLVDLIAREKISLQRSTIRGFSTPMLVEDNYLILVRPRESTFELVEYRMDAAGHPLDSIGTNLGLLATRGFALMSEFFASKLQRESLFRYLGEQKIGSRDVYVIAFAQKPDLATMVVSMRGRDDTRYPLLVQGIAWIDKYDFQIVRLRTDLLAPRPDLALDYQTTEITFSEVRLVDVPAPFWLPKDVKVYVGMKQPGSARSGANEVAFRNEHHYSDYRRYRVSVRMVPAQ